MILVAGGTGRLGTLVVGGLTTRGERVRVLTRDVSRAGGLVGPLVDVVQGDVRDPASLRPAMAGVSTVVSAVHGFAGPGRVDPTSVDRDGNANLVAAAKTEKADMVLVSVVGAAAQHPMELFRMKAAAEENLRASGVPWTIIRATAFLEMYRDLIRRTVGKSGRPLIFGRGENLINFVPVADVAQAVVQAVFDPSRRRHTMTVTGPQNLSLNDLAAITQRELGTIAEPPRHVPRPVLHLLAATRVITSSAMARQANAALIMDTTDMTFTTTLTAVRRDITAGPGHVHHTPPRTHP